MTVLIGIAFLAGVITSISPCILPVLPILLAGSATGPPRRPYAIVAGLVTSFTVFTLFAVALLDALGLPQDLLRDLAIGLLLLLGASLIVPAFGELLARPFLRLTRRSGNDLGGGFLLGASLGLVFVPCVGPVIAAVAGAAATHDVGFEAAAITLAYAVGAAVPMLLIALWSRRAAHRIGTLRAHAPVVRRVLGGVIALTALAIAFGFDRPFQTALPGYTNALQSRVEESAVAADELDRLTKARRQAEFAADEALPDFGPAPDFVGISQWLNTPGERGLSLREELRGRVVLIDVWTYSCINCLRTLPHVKSWDAKYRRNGLTIVGLHAPEFAFERVEGNVREQVDHLGITYPVALDNDFATWHAYRNRYWPAKYLIDRDGHLRYWHIGEGDYGENEDAIRLLLAEQAPSLPPRSRLPDRTPSGVQTPETYLGYERIDNYAGSPLRSDRAAAYEFPASLDPNEFALEGQWLVRRDRVTAGVGSGLRLRFRGSSVHLVLAGKGRVDVLLDGKRLPPVHVRRSTLYKLAQLPKTREALLELRFSPGVEAFAFTFGGQPASTEPASATAPLGRPTPDLPMRRDPKRRLVT